MLQSQSTSFAEHRISNYRRTDTELQQRNRLETVRRKTSGECGVGGMFLAMAGCVWVVVVGGGGGGAIKIVLIARNLILNSDAAPNYKYMFGEHRGSFYLICKITQ